MINVAGPHLEKLEASKCHIKILLSQTLTILLSQISEWTHLEILEASICHIKSTAFRHWPFYDHKFQRRLTLKSYKTSSWMWLSAAIFFRDFELDVRPVWVLNIHFHFNCELSRCIRLKYIISFSDTSTSCVMQCMLNILFYIRVKKR